jgi:fibronectin-binding autotransporter adhesin
MSTFRILCTALGLALLGSTAQAEVKRWGRMDNNAWVTASLWSPTGMPVSTDDVLYTNIGGANSASFLGGDFTINSWAFTNTSSTQHWVSATGGSSTSNYFLTLDGLTNNALGGSDVLASVGEPGGLISIGGNTPRGIITLTLGAATSFSFHADAVNQLFIQSPIAGADGKDLSFRGPGRLILQGANTFGGPATEFTLESGTLVINHSNALGNAANTIILNGGAIDKTVTAWPRLRTQAHLWSNSFSFVGSQALHLGAGSVSIRSTNLIITVVTNTLTVGGVIDGGGVGNGFTKDGAGALRLDGLNVFSGPINVLDGSLQVTNVNATGVAGPLGFSTGSIVSLGTTGKVGVLSIQGTGASVSDRRFDVPAGVGQFNFASGNATVTLNNVISGAGQVQKFGTGTLVLNGTNTFSGRLTIGAGTVRVERVNNVGDNGPLGSGALPIFLGNGATIGTLAYTGPTTNMNKSFTLNGLRGVLNMPTAGAELTLSGAITGDGEFWKMGTGTVVLTGNNSFTNKFTIQGGTVIADAPDVPGVSGALGNNAWINLFSGNSDAQTMLIRQNTSIGSINGGSVNVLGLVIANDSTLTIGGDNTSPGSFNWAIRGTNASIVKVGAGELQLSHPNSINHTGPTIISNGALRATAPINFSPVIVAGGLLTGSPRVNTLTLDAGGIAPVSNGLPNSIRVTNGLALNAGTLYIDITNALSAGPDAWDIIRVGTTGSGTVSVGTGPITVDLIWTNATLDNFDATNAISWTIVDAGSVTGFDSNKFTVSTANFAPSLQGGSFKVRESDGDILLDFVPFTITELSPVSIGPGSTPDTLTLSSTSFVVDATYYVEATEELTGTWTSIQTILATNQTMLIPVTNIGPKLFWRMAAPIP